MVVVATTTTTTTQRRLVFIHIWLMYILWQGTYIHVMMNTPCEWWWWLPMYPPKTLKMYIWMRSHACIPHFNSNRMYSYPDAFFCSPLSCLVAQSIAFIQCMSPQMPSRSFYHFTHAFLCQCYWMIWFGLVFVWFGLDWLGLIRLLLVTQTVHCSHTYIANREQYASKRRTVELINC